MCPMGVIGGNIVSSQFVLKLRSFSFNVVTCGQAVVASLNSCAVLSLPEKSSSASLEGGTTAWFTGSAWFRLWVDWKQLSGSRVFKTLSRSTLAGKRCHCACMQLHSDQFDFSQAWQRDRLWFCVEARRRPTARWQRRFTQSQELDACWQRRSEVNVRQMETAKIRATLIQIGKECRTRSRLVDIFWNNAYVGTAVKQPCTPTSDFTTALNFTMWRIDEFNLRAYS